MNQIDPLVSVGIPTYNRAKKLERAVQTLMGGSYKNLEIIISDNASSDETQVVCRNLSASDGRVKYFRHTENLGPNKNFEFARGQATGKYFLWNADDDYFDPDYIRTCADELERDSSLVLASGIGAFYTDDNSLVGYGNVISCDSSVPLIRVLKYLWLVADNSIFYGVYRTDRIKECRPPNCLAGDWAWVAEVLLRGRAKILPSVLVHRDTGRGLSTSIAGMVSALGGPRWHATFPWTAVTMNIARHLACESTEYRQKSLPNKIVSYILIGSVLVVKGTIMNIRTLGAKIPYVRKIYRKYFKRQNWPR